MARTFEGRITKINAMKGFKSLSERKLGKLLVENFKIPSRCGARSSKMDLKAFYVYFVP